MSNIIEPTEEVVQVPEPVDTYYAKIDSNAVVLEVFKNPTKEFLEDYNAKNTSRLRQCPPETKKGWIRINGEFRAK